MIWLCVEKSGLELMGSIEPKRDGGWWSFLEDVCMECQCFEMDQSIELPRGTIEKMIGKKLTYEDNAVRIDKDGVVHWNT